MGIINASASGSTKNLDSFLREMKANSEFDALERYGQAGVDALATATPHDTGVSSESWYYEITSSAGGYTITWLNSDKDSQGTPIVILIQFGHGTGTGGYVEPIDFINPVTEFISEDVTNAVWKAVQSA